MMSGPRIVPGLKPIDDDRSNAKGKQKDTKKHRASKTSDTHEVDDFDVYTDAILRNYYENENNPFQFNPDKLLNQNHVFQHTAQKMRETLYYLGFQEINTLNNHNNIDDDAAAEKFRAFINSKTAQAHILYAHGVDGSDPNWKSKFPNPRTLRSLEQTVTDVRNSNIYKYICKKYELTEHFLIAVPKKTSLNEDHWVAATRKGNELRIINPKGGVLAKMSDPDIDYVETAIAPGETLDTTIIHSGAQAFNDRVNCGRFVAETIAIACSNMDVETQNQAMREITLDRASHIPPIHVPKEEDINKKNIEIQKLKNALTVFCKFYTRHPVEVPESLRNIHGKPCTWEQLTEIAKIKVGKTKDPMLKQAFKLVIELSEAYCRFDAEVLGEKISQYNFYANTFQTKNSYNQESRAFQPHLGDLIPKDFNKDIEFMALNYSSNKTAAPKNFLIGSTPPSSILSSFKNTFDTGYSGLTGNRNPDPMRLTDEFKLGREKRKLVDKIIKEIVRLQVNENDWSRVLASDLSSDLKIDAYRQILRAIYESEPDKPINEILGGILDKPLEIEGLHWDKSNKVYKNENDKDAEIKMSGYCENDKGKLVSLRKTKVVFR